MGSGIAELCAKAGLDVVVAVSSPPSAAAGLQRLEYSLGRAVEKGVIDKDGRDAALERVTFTTQLEDMADRQFVIEAVTEDECVKAPIFRRLDAIIEDGDAVLASNTSSLSIARLAAATARPGRVVGVHFFNPAPVLPLVEIVACVLTDADAAERAERFVIDTLGKHAVRSPDRAGFIVNSLLFPYLTAAVRMVESGIADPETVDRSMVLGCAHPMGPLALLDLIGLDVAVSIADALYHEFKEPLYAPPPLLKRMTEAGLLGRKSGRGFHTYR
jgi:3-hydroxybutyryl-CoA dehydrogenase